MTPPTTALDELTLVGLRRLNDVCNRYERDCRLGLPPPIEPYLADVPPDERPVVREELGQLEREYGLKDPSRDPAQSGSLAGRAFVPDTLGHFTIQGELGRGAFGVVYRAFDSQLRRPVALKVPRADVRLPAEWRERFQQEARAAAGLDHPGIVPVFEVGECGDVTYLVSAYCPGITLAEWLRHQTAPVPVDAAARLVQALALAIDHAHRRGVLHRDLKPSNVLLSPRGETPPGATDAAGLGAMPLGEFTPKITDFGLAKLVNANVETQSGATMGTPVYMSPEQGMPDTSTLGPPADVYSLGVIAYELLTGRPPYRAETAVKTLLLAKSQEPVRPSCLRPHLPRDLETICLKCLEKEPRRRYTSADDLASDLARFLAGEPIRARPLGPLGRVWRSARRHPAIAALLGLLVVVFLAGFAGVLWQWQRAESNAAQARRQRDTALAERAYANRNLERTRQALDRLTSLGVNLRNQPGMNQTGRDVLELVLTCYREIQADRIESAELRHQTALAGMRVGSISHHFREWRDCDSAYCDAISLLEQLHADNPDDAAIRADLARCLLDYAHSLKDRGLNQPAIDGYRRVADLARKALNQFPDDPANASTLAISYLNWCVPLSAERRWAEAEELNVRAIETFRTLCKQRPDEVTFHLRLALSLDGYALHLLERGRAPEAEPYCRDALALREHWLPRANGNRTDVRYLARSHSNLGRILDALDRGVDARVQHRRAIEILEPLMKDFANLKLFHDVLIRYYLYYGDSFRLRNQHTEASQLYRKAASLDPQGGPVRSQVAWRLITSPDPTDRDPKSALALAQQAVDTSPHIGDCWTTLAYVLVRQGKVDDAMAAVHRAQALHRGGIGEDFLILAQAHALRGEGAKARESYEKGVQWFKQDGVMSPELARLRQETDQVLARGTK